MSEQLVQLDPSEVLADDNTRFNLKRPRIDSLKESILEQGGVLEPVEVEALKPPVNGFKYRLTTGFYRHKSVEELNKDQNAGLTLPAIIREIADGPERIKRQLAENMERENQSPMDKAVAIKRLLDGGVGKPEVRRIFTTTVGKNTQPMSNAYLNILVRLLELPKAIQEKIHDGRVGLEAAYVLGKVPADKRAAVLDRAEKDRQALIDLEAADERKYLAAVAKAEEASAKEAAAAKEADAARADVEQATKLVSEKVEALKALKKTPNYLEMEEAEKKVFSEKLKAADVDVKSAQRVKKEADNKLAKALGTVKSAAEVAEEKKAQLDATRKAAKGKAGKGKGSAVGVADIKSAAKKSGDDVGLVPLSASEVRQTLKDLIREGVPPRVAGVAKAFKDCFDGKDTPKELLHNLSVILGYIAKPATPAPAKAEMPAAPDVKQGPVAKVKKTA